MISIYYKGLDGMEGTGGVLGIGKSAGWSLKVHVVRYHPDIQILLSTLL